MPREPKPVSEEERNAVQERIANILADAAAKKKAFDDAKAKHNFVKRIVEDDQEQ